MRHTKHLGKYPNLSPTNLTCGERELPSCLCVCLSQVSCCDETIRPGCWDSPSCFDRDLASRWFIFFVFGFSILCHDRRPKLQWKSKSKPFAKAGRQPRCVLFRFRTIVEDQKPCFGRPTVFASQSTALSKSIICN